MSRMNHLVCAITDRRDIVDAATDIIITEDMTAGRAHVPTSGPFSGSRDQKISPVGIPMNMYDQDKSTWGRMKSM
jgi:hypothetical protein